MPARDPHGLAPALRPWFADHAATFGVDPEGLTVTVARLAGDGHSNEVLVATLEGHAPGGSATTTDVVVRLPPEGDALFPTADLDAEVAAQRLAGANGVPVPEPLVHEPDPSILGVPFLAMPLVAGHCPGALPALDPWVGRLSPDGQRALHRSFLDVLARIHTAPVVGPDPAAGGRPLRGAGASLVEEVTWWTDLVTWLLDGETPTAVADAFAWCHARVPDPEPPPGLLWGDVRMGNVIAADDGSIAAVLDWEMASIGPAELDLGWCTALDAMGVHFTGAVAPGFLPRAEVLDRHADALGRPLVAIEWFEAFALCRSMVLNLRRSRLEAAARGRRPRPVEGDAVVAYVLDHVASLP